MKNSPELKNMLSDLFVHRRQPTKGRDLAARVLRIEGNDFVERGGVMREQISSLRQKLQDFERDNPTAYWVFSIDKGSNSTGYQLKVKRTYLTPSESFWSDHFFSTRSTPIVCDPLLFFYDHSSVKVTRFMDTNIDRPSLAGASEELKRKHLPDFKEGLVSGHQYIDIGSFLAIEHIRNWFFNNFGEFLNLQLSYESPSKDLLNSSPIFVGSSRTNAFLREFFSSKSASRIRYRLHSEDFAYITVNDPRPRDIKSLTPLGLKVANGMGLLPTTSAELTLGIVTRVPNPGGTGHFTVISSDATYAVDKMAAALCSDDQLSRIMRHIEWPLDLPLPDTFEWLFLVRLWPGGAADEASEAELLTWRMPAPDVA